MTANPRSRLVLAAIAVTVAACVSPGASADPTEIGGSPGATGRPSPVETGTAAPSSQPEPSDGVVRVPLEGHGPLGIDVLDAVAWVVAFDSGTLIGVDLTPAGGQQVIDGAGGATHVIAGPDQILVARIDAPGGAHLGIADPATASVRGLVVPSLAGFAIGDEGVLWCLGNAGEVVVVDAARTTILGQTAIEIHDLEHLDAVFGGGAFWASSDTTGVRRLEGTDPVVTAEVETGGGIPLAYVDGLVWGARADELWAIDPGTSAVTIRVPLTDLIEILDLDVADGVAWIAGRKPGRIGVVRQIEIATGAILGETLVSLPAGIEVAGDRAWVTDYETDSLIGIVAARN